jgi:hypothetical protein
MAGVLIHQRAQLRDSGARKFLPFHRDTARVNIDVSRKVAGVFISRRPSAISPFETTDGKPSKHA